MKKILLVSLAFMAICVASCSNNDEMPTQANQSLVVNVQEPTTYSLEYLNLKDQLETYNAAFWQENEVPQTRLFGFFKRKWKNLSKADGFGAFFGMRFGFLGSLFGGALFSTAVALIIPYEEVIEVQPILPLGGGDASVCTDPDQGTWEPPVGEVYQSIVSVNRYTYVTTEGTTGYLHNHIISKIDEDSPNVFNSPIVVSNMAESILDEMEASNYNVSQEVENAIINEANRIIARKDEVVNGDLTTFLQTMVPEHAGDIDILDDFVENVSNLTDITTIQNYLAGYLQTIQNSDLTNEAKERLAEGIEVAANSSVLWEVTEVRE